MGAYLSAREAADFCGVSEKTVRNWLHAGRLSAEKSEGAFRIPQAELVALKRNGPRTSSADRQAEGSAEDVRAEGPHTVPVADVLALIREAQAEAIAKAEAAAMWQARAEMLAHRLAAAEDRIKALDAPRTHAASNLTARDDELTTEPSDPPRPPGPSTPAPIPPKPDGAGWWGWVKAWLTA